MGDIEVPLDCSIVSNSQAILILAACLDAGVIMVPKLMVQGELAAGRLRELLPDYVEQRQLGVYAVYPNRKPPAKVTEFINFVKSELPTIESADRWAPYQSGPGSAFRT